MDKNAPRGKYYNWSKENLGKALAMIKSKKISILGASKRFGIPRRTLGGYVKSGASNMTKNGRPPVLTEAQEIELVSRVVRLADVGFPVTPKVLRRCVYIFCEKNNIKQRFNEIKGCAGRKWLKGFLQRHPDIARRKSQHLNEARAQKLNKFIVNDYFKTLREVMGKLDIIDKPERIYNVDEKGCRLSLHRQPYVLAKTGSKRVHYRGKEHGENVTIVACGNAVGNVIPPMVLFKGKRMKQELADNLPVGSIVEMTPKGSMTSQTFVRWLHHFNRYKSAGECLVIMDGAKCHLDYSIVEAAEDMGVTLLCLPSNTTHELQPMDKSVFGPFETFWDDELMNFWTTFEDHEFNKQRFGYVFTPVWDKSATPKNVKAGFEACGIFPLNPNKIPEEAFAPSQTTEIPLPVPPVGPSHTQVVPHDLPKDEHEEETEEHEDDSSAWDSDDSHGNLQPSKKRKNVSFNDILSTPNTKSRRPKRNRPPINSRAIQIQKSLFPSSLDPAPCKSNTLDNPISTSTPKTIRSQKTSRPHPKTKPGAGKSTDSWYCFICKKDRVLDMRCCNLCNRYVHEECVGLTKKDKGAFVCPECAK